MKIGVLTNMPTPYRRKMWTEYSQINGVQLTYFYCIEKEKDRFWNVPLNYKVEEIYLKGFTLKNNTHVNFNIINYFKNYDAWIIGGYNTITAQILIILCKIMKIPYSLMVDGVNPQKLSESKKGIINSLKTFYIKGQTAAFANGIVGREMMLKYGVKPDIIFNQYLTVDINNFIKEKIHKEKYYKEIRNKYGISNNEILLIYVGRIIEDKGIQDVINVVRRLRKKGLCITFLVVGEGIYKSYLKKLSSENTKVIFTGEISYDQLPKYYYASDIFILPTYEDVWGLAINEAMACGLPIITTTSAGAYLDLVKENGYIYNAKDEMTLERNILKALGIEGMDFSTVQSKLVKKRLNILGKKSINIIKKFSFDKSVKEFEKLLNYLSTKIV